MAPLDLLGELSAVHYPNDALEAAKTVLVHDLAVAKSARSLLADMLTPPEPSATDCTDLATGARIAAHDAVARNGQLIHGLTQDDTHIPAMSHVGATSIPLLLALGEQHDVPVASLLSGLAATFAAAEAIGEPVAWLLAARGVRATPVVGPLAALVGLGRMLDWGEARTKAAVARAASVAFGTAHSWADGAQEWLFQVAAANGLALAAARSSAQNWTVSSDPLWGTAGTFRCLGLETSPPNATTADRFTLAATRSNLKRFPACAFNQVALTLLQDLPREPARSRAIDIHLSVPEASFPGIDRCTGLTTWSSRLLSLQYCLAVMASEGDFTVRDLQAPPVALTADDLAAVTVHGTPELSMGSYCLEVDGQDTIEASMADFGRPCRDELLHAASAAIGTNEVQDLLALLDDDGTSVRRFAHFVGGLP